MSSDIDQLAVHTSQILKKWYTPILDKFTGDDPSRFIFMFLDGTGKRLGWDSNLDDPFEPITGSSDIGQSFYFGHKVKPTDGKRYLNKAQKRLNNGIQRKSAFSELMDELSDEGRRVGGKIFCEVLHPAKQSKFSQALMK